MTTYSTFISQNFGGTIEIYEVTFEYCADFTSDGYNDVRVTVTNTTAGASDDLIGIAFDVNDYTGSVFSDLTVTVDSGATGEPGVPNVVIGDEMVADDGPLDPGFNTSGGGSAEPFDVGILFSAPGAAEYTQSVTFTMSLTGQHLEADDLLNGTDWFIRTQSTEGGGSAKTFDTIVGLPDCGPPPPPPCDDCEEPDGEGNTPGFWKNHPLIFLMETGASHEDSWEDIFGFDLGSLDGKFGRQLDDATLHEALSAKGGNESALLRSSTAAWANASSDDVGYGYEDDDALSGGVEEALGLSAPDILTYTDAYGVVDPAYYVALDDYNTLVATTVDEFQFLAAELDMADGDVTGALSAEDVIAATVDVLEDGVHDATGLDVGELALLFDALNNMPSVETSDFLL